jgi:hypothetical protein
MTRRFLNPLVFLKTQDINYNRYTKHKFTSSHFTRGECEQLAESNNPMGQTFMLAIANRYCTVLLKD